MWVRKKYLNFWNILLFSHYNNTYNLSLYILFENDKFSIKYAIFNDTSVANWAFSNHSSGITLSLTNFFFLIRTKAKMNFGKHVSERKKKQ
jgi:hypothetical protein